MSINGRINKARIPFFFHVFTKKIVSLEKNIEKYVTFFEKTLAFFISFCYYIPCLCSYKLFLGGATNGKM